MTRSSAPTPVPERSTAVYQRDYRPRQFRHALRAYLREIVQSYFSTLKGFHITAKVFFSRPYTIQYPEQSTRVPEQFRGLHEFDVVKCTACELCIKACPVDCIALESIGKGKKARLQRYAIDYSKCMFCHLCCEACPTDAIRMGARWNLARYERAECGIEFSTRYPDPPAPSEAPMPPPTESSPAQASASPPAPPPASPPEANA